MIDRLTDMHLKNKRVTVMGLGTFGGGVAATNYLAWRGAHVTVTDLRSATVLRDSLSNLNNLSNLKLRLGGHVECDFREADLLVVNPAVPPDNRFLQIARTCGVSLTSEMNLFWQHNRGQTVAVTGSNGKSTTTALIHALLTAGGLRCWLGGNIGNSLLPVVDQIQPQDWVVLELSSFQLEDLDRIQASPDIAVVTNLSPNHLDRHGSMQHYRRAKQAILRWQNEKQTAILNGDDPDVARWMVNGKQLFFGSHDRKTNGVFHQNESGIIRSQGSTQRVPIKRWLQLPGIHNLQNALAAVCAASEIGVDRTALQNGLQGFQPLPHRLQLVTEFRERRFYNDSIATTPESACAALESFDDPIILLAGGYDKQVDLSKMAKMIAKNVKAVALMGQTARTLEQQIRQFADGRSITTQQSRSFADAFAWAFEQSSPGDVVLLSPGCASYDWFQNFTERGDTFRLLTQEMNAAFQKSR